MPGPARPMLRARLRLTSLAVLLAGSQAVLLTRRPRAAAVARSATDAAAAVARSTGAEPLVTTLSAGFDARLERTDGIPRVRIEMLPSKVDADDGHNMAAFMATVLDRDEDFIAFFDLRAMQVGLRSKKTFAFGIDFMAQERHATRLDARVKGVCLLVSSCVETNFGRPTTSMRCCLRNCIYSHWLISTQVSSPVLRTTARWLVALCDPPAPVHLVRDEATAAAVFKLFASGQGAVDDCALIDAEECALDDVDVAAVAADPMP